MADKRISQLAERTDIANNDVVAIVASGATVTNKATISSIQSYMQTALDVGVTSVGVTLGSSGTDVSVTGSPITTSGNITINIPSASATNRGVLTSEDWSTFNAKQPAGNYLTTDTTQTITGAKTFDQDIFVNGRRIGRGAGNITSNTTVGNAALRDNTTGSENSAFGGGALREITTGSANTAVGFGSMLNSETGGGNTAIGNSTLAGNNGSNNIAVGNSAGRYIAGGTTLNETSLNSVYLGANTRPSADGNTNEIVIGENAVGNGSNTVTIGKSSTTDNYFTGTVRSTALRLAEAGTANPTILRNTSGTSSTTTGSNVIGFNGTNNIFVTTQNRGGFILGFNNSVSNREYTLQDASGTLAFTSDITNSLTGFVPYTGATGSVDLGVFLLNASKLVANGVSDLSQSGSLLLKQLTNEANNTLGYTTISVSGSNSINFGLNQDASNSKNFSLSTTSLTSNVARTYTLQDASGTLAFTSDIPSITGLVTLDTAQTITGEKTFTNNIILKNSALAGLIVSSFSPNALEIGATLAGITYYSSIVFPAGDQSWNLPNASGTIALTSDLGAYVTLGTAQTITAQKTFSTSGGDDTLIVNHTSGSGIALDIAKAGNGEGLRVAKSSGSGNAVTITGGLLSAEAATLTGALNGTSASFSGDLTVDTNTLFVDSTNNRVGIGIASPATPLHILTSGLPAIRLTLGSEARVHNINGVNNGRDLNVLPFRNFSVQTGNGINEGIITLNAYEDFVVGTGSSYTPRLTIASTGAATFSSSVTAAVGQFSQSAGNTLQAYQTSATNSATAIIRQTGAGGNSNNDIGLVVDIQGAADNDRIANFRYFDGTNFNSRVSIMRGGGITFNGDTAAANALDDYEEGTWTMGISFGGASVGVTTSANTGTYTKIGRQVTVNGYLILTNKGSSTGAARITGLPFTIPNVLANYCAPSLYINFITFANQFTGVGQINATTIGLNEVTEAGIAGDLTNSDFANNSEIIVSMTYFV